MTCVLVNIGEAVIFSMGGLGLMFWLWLGLAMRGTHPLPTERTRPDSRPPSRFTV